MRDYYSLGPVPANEECVPAEEGSREQQMRECRAYQHQLERLFPNLPEGMRFGIKAFEHELGMYREVVIHYDPDCENHLQAFTVVDHNSPDKWDTLAKIELMPRLSAEQLADDLLTGMYQTY